MIRHLLVGPIVGLMLIGLAACGTVGPQAKAGLNVIEIEWQVPDDTAGMKYLHASFGKDSETVDVSFPVPGKDGGSLGTASFSATGNSGVAAQKLRAELEAKWPEALKSIAPDAISAVVDILSPVPKK